MDRPQQGGTICSRCIFGPGGPLFRRDLRSTGGTIKRVTGQNGYVATRTYVVAGLLFSNSRLLAAFSLYHVSYSVVLEPATVHIIYICHK